MRHGLHSDIVWILVVSSTYQRRVAAGVARVQVGCPLLSKVSLLCRLKSSLTIRLESSLANQSWSIYQLDDGPE